MMAAVLGALALRRARPVQGVGYLSLAFLSFSASIATIAAQSLLPELVWMLGANLGLVAGALGLYDGLARMYGWRVDRWWYLPLLMLVAVGLIFFTEFVPNFGARRALVDLSIGILYVIVIFRLAREKGLQALRFGERLLALSLMFLIANTVFRLSFIVVSDRLHQAMHLFSERHSALLMFLMAGSLGVILIGLSLVFIVQDRLLEKIEIDAARDDLTGVMTRSVVLEVLERLLAKVSRDGQPVGILVVDIDHFKRVNDQFGHRVGDLVLSNVARAMRSVLRADSFIGRLGGEEFVIITSGIGREDFYHFAERLRSNVQTWETPVRSQRIQVTVSVGGCLVTPENIAELEDPLHLADIAMYRAKANGRNQVVMHSSAS